MRRIVKYHDAPLSEITSYSCARAALSPAHDAQAEKEEDNIF